MAYLCDVKCDAINQQNTEAGKLAADENSATNNTQLVE